MREWLAKVGLGLLHKLQLTPLSGRGGWWTIVREPFTGAWQQNGEVRTDTALSYSAVFACTTLIISDIGKMTLRLMERDARGIWNEIDNPAYSPVLRRPNHYQNGSQFRETWIGSKLNAGNTYALKARDGANKVAAIYVLDPCRVTPLVAPDGAVYYQLKRDDLSEQPRDEVTVPASEIIHDRFNCLFHPLVGLSPIFACATVASKGLAIQNNSSKFFQNGSIPGGILTAPGAISKEQAERLKTKWQDDFGGDNVGKIAVMSDGLKFEPLAFKAQENQLIEQLKITGEQICSCYHVPPYLVDIGPPPPYANVDPVIQKYYSECLQTLINAFELCLDEGLSLGRQFGNAYGTELDPDDLIWLNAEAKSKAAQDGIGSGGMSPDEARRRYFGLGPVEGGDTPYLQQQMYSLGALARRDAEAPPPPTPPITSGTPDPAPTVNDLEQDSGEMLRKALAA